MEPTLAHVLRAAMDSRLLELHTMLPGKIVSYDSATETATVSLVAQSLVVTGDGSLQGESFPDVQDVPVCFPRGAGGKVFMKWNLEPGDGVMLMFSEVSPNGFRKNGEASKPADGTRHSISYPVAIPGWVPESSLGDQVKEEKTLTLEAETIKLGSVAEELIARADRVEDELEKIKDAFNGHQHLYFPALSPAPTAVETTGANTYTPGSVGCDKVKGE